MVSVKKAKIAMDAKRLDQIPNVGPAMVKDFQILGIDEPMQLKGLDAYELYVNLCHTTKAYHDPCVLDTFLAAIYFMDGKGARPWWDFTEERKKKFGLVEGQVKQWTARR